MVDWLDERNAGGWLAAPPRRRRRREGKSGVEALKNAKSAGAAASPLISLETAKENVWNSLEKAWKRLDFPWKSLKILGKSLEKLGKVWSSSTRHARPRT
jgi:hypothetical protein